ncbi:hypothetical protein [Paenibacillus sophorae]|uniref:Uncharacterized protein n=1 Tax=Paenibacillus sophorae TaxID=1333845 RepID=A0ABX8HEB6_9BACL|nr:hypothetical protein [Paenibacillus sophorae]QWU16247.1 hypothetical protein KP014_02950 [Paenibacillus sophorae]
MEYYEDYLYYYQHQSTENKKRLAQKLLESNPRAVSITGQNTRIVYTVAIFSNEWDKEMLKAVIESNHPSVTSEIKDKAKQLLNKLVVK